MFRLVKGSMVQLDHRSVIPSHTAPFEPFHGAQHLCFCKVFAACTSWHGSVALITALKLRLSTVWKGTMSSHKLTVISLVISSCCGSTFWKWLLDGGLDQFLFLLSCVLQTGSRVGCVAWQCWCSEYSSLLLVGRLKSKPRPNNGCCTGLFHQLLHFAFSHV